MEYWTCPTCGFLACDEFEKDVHLRNVPAEHLLGKDSHKKLEPVINIEYD